MFVLSFVDIKISQQNKDSFVKSYLSEFTQLRCGVGNDKQTCIDGRQIKRVHERIWAGRIKVKGSLPFKLSLHTQKPHKKLLIKPEPSVFTGNFKLRLTIG